MTGGAHGQDQDERFDALDVAITALEIALNETPSIEALGGRLAAPLASLSAAASGLLGHLGEGADEA